MPPLRWLAALVLLGPVAAQATSPAWAAAHEAGSANAIPFGIGPCRYQQAHGDLRGTPRVVTELAFRGDAGGVVPAVTARRLELELTCGETELGAVGTTFDQNWLAPPVVVVARRSIDVPAADTAPVNLPAPWTLTLGFDAPWSCSGAHDFAWEMRVHAATSSTPWYADAMTGLSFERRATGAAAALGLGCTTANGTLTLRSAITADAAHASASWRFAITGAPALARSALAISDSGPAIPLAAACGSGEVRLGALLVLVPFAADAAGNAAWTVTGLPIERAWEGRTFDCQVAASDPAQGPLPLAFSNGVRAAVPPLVAPPLLTRVWALAPTAGSGACAPGEGLVVRLR